MLRATAAHGASRRRFAHVRGPGWHAGKERHAGGFGAGDCAAEAGGELLQIPGWIGAGQGLVQAAPVTSKRLTLDVEHLPYNRPLLEWLRDGAWRGAGRSTWPRRLTAGLAERVAALMSASSAVVLASDGGDEPCGGATRLAAFRERFPSAKAFVTSAMRRPDIAELLAACVSSRMVANPDRSL